jgi:SAM-dependent methyltransferase
MSDKEKRRSNDVEPQEVPWYEEAFGEFYADLYAHRSPAEVVELLGAIERTRPLDGPALDVACGGGRLVRELAEFGLSAVGVDLSLPLLRRARRLGKDLQLARSDMRSLPVRGGAFATVFFLFTSFGYFDDPAEDESVIQGAARALRPGGWLVLDFLNPRPTLEGLVPESVREVRGMEVHERRRYVPETRQIK